MQRLGLLLIVLCCCAAVTCAQAADEPALPIEWSSVDEHEREVVGRLLKSPDWPIRVFALLRLERYSGEQVCALIRLAVADDAWQVRCFALQIACRMDCAVDPAQLAGEQDPFVIRAALRHGITLPEEKVSKLTLDLLKSNQLEQSMIGMEIAGACNLEWLRKNAEQRAEKLIRSMDDRVAAVLRRRLARLFDAPTELVSASHWRTYLRQIDGPLPFRRAEAFVQQARDQSMTVIATIEPRKFEQLLGYLDVLRRRDLEFVIVMDFTQSMTAMINATRAGVDGLILFLRDISRSLRMAFVAYRDHDNPPVWEGHPFTDDIMSIREFLFRAQITGGTTIPEAVLDGLNACSELKWNREAERGIILIGDAEPHDDDRQKLAQVLAFYQEHAVTVHVVHVPYEPPARWRGRLSAADRQKIAQRNQRAAAAFQAIAEGGRGRFVTLDDPEELVPALMGFWIEQAWWPTFDEFYDLYLDVCR